MDKVERTFFVPDLNQCVQFFEALLVFKVNQAGYPRAFIGFPKENPTFTIDVMLPHTAEDQLSMEAQHRVNRVRYHFYLDQFDEWESEIRSRGVPVRFTSNLPLGTLASATDSFGNVFTFSPNPSWD